MNSAEVTATPNDTPLDKFDLVTLAIVILGLAIAYGAAWYTAFTFPNALEYEGTMLWAANLLAQGQNIYDPARLTEAPWAVITYPPLFLLLGSLLVKLFGASFWCLRIVSVVSMLFSTFLLFRILRLSGCSKLVASVAPAYFLGYSPVFLWSAIGRPDMLAVALCLLGLERTYIIFLNEQEKQRLPIAPIAVASAAFALALYAKQTSLVCLASAILFLFWCKRFKPALAIGVGVCVIYGALMLLTQTLTGGFVQNITIFGSAQWSSDVCLRYLHFMNDSDVLRCEISFCAVLFCIIFRKQNTTAPERLPYTLFALSFAQMIYILGLPGSNGNHAIFTLMALSWWLTLKVDTMSKRLARVILLASLIAIPSLTTYLHIVAADLPKGENPLLSLDLKDKLVLSEDPYLNILSHSKPAMVDCAVFTSIWQNKPDKLEQLAQAFQKKEFAAVVINCQDSEGKEKYFWPDSILSALKESYRDAGKLCGNGICQKLWLPKQAVAKRNVSNN